jgi:hypothetical protein
MWCHLLVVKQKIIWQLIWYTRFQLYKVGNNPICILHDNINYNDC